MTGCFNVVVVRKKYWKEYCYLLFAFLLDNDGLCIYMHTCMCSSHFQRGGWLLLLCTKLLLWTGILLFGEVAAYVHAVPCCYLHSTVTRLKITDCPNASCPFYHRTGQVSPPQALIQLDEAISLTPPQRARGPPGLRLGRAKCTCMNLQSPSSSKQLC